MKIKNISFKMYCSLLNPFFPEIRFEEQKIVRRTVFNRIDDRLSCIIQDNLDAYIQEPKDPKERINWDMFSYFCIPIRVGVKSNGPTVETFDYTLQFQRLGIDGPDDLDLEIVDAEPKKEVKTFAGKGVTHDKTKESTKGGRFGGKVDLSFNPVANIEASADLGGRETNKVTENYSYEKQILSSFSLAAGSHVNWRFTKHGSIGVEGRYELAVYFRLKIALSEITEGRGMYVAHPSIIVNNQRLTENWIEYENTHSPLKPMEVYFHIRTPSNE